MSSYAFHRATPVARRKRRTRDFVKLAMLVALPVILLLWIAARQSFLVDLGYRISDLRQETAALKEERERLYAERARLMRPDRILRQSLSIGLRPVPESGRFEVRLEERPSLAEEPETLVAGIGREY